MFFDASLHLFLMMKRPCNAKKGATERRVYVISMDSARLSVKDEHQSRMVGLFFEHK